MQMPAPPPAALTCPRCNAGAAPAPGAQRCASCGGAFTLFAGARLDPSVVPPPFDPRLPKIVVKSAGLVLLKRGMVAPEGISSGTLDPITGMIPMDQSGVLFGDIFTVAVWRKIDVLRFVLALLFPVPFALLLLFMCVAVSPGFLVLALPIAFWAGFLVYSALGTRACWVRVAGVWRTLTIRFDKPMWRRRRFHDELLRRAGIAARAMP